MVSPGPDADRTRISEPRLSGGRRSLPQLRHAGARPPVKQPPPWRSNALRTR
jgi:hypothetical protein